jgi:tetratricopeptide (TPR) repeat protein
VTGCVVARDEEAHLAGCLASLEGAVDELLVVDHGSRDATARVARAAGARVITADAAHHEIARNAYLEAARTPWVLVLDADERLDEAARPAVRSLIREAPGDVMAFAQERYDYLGRGRWASARIVRLFRAHPAIRYFQSRAHASVVPAIEALGGRIAHARAPLHHLDALLPRDHATKREGMRARLAAEIDDGAMAVMRCFLALELFARGDDREASEQLHEAMRQNARCEPIARLFLAQQHRARGRLDEAAAEARRVLAGERAFRGRANAWVVLADAHDRQGDAAAARAAARDALAEGPSASHHLNLAALLEDVDREAARAHLDRACEANPWLLSASIFGDATPTSIFHQQDALLARVPRGDVLATRLGRPLGEPAHAASILR